TSSIGRTSMATWGSLNSSASPSTRRTPISLMAARKTRARNGSTTVSCGHGCCGAMAGRTPSAPWTPRAFTRSRGSPKPVRSSARSDDGGDTWAPKMRGITPPDANFYPPLVLDPAHSGTADRLLLGTDRVYETTNNAQTWSALGSFVFPGHIDALAAA